MKIKLDTKEKTVTVLKWLQNRAIDTEEYNRLFADGSTIKTRKQALEFIEQLEKQY